MKTRMMLLRSIVVATGFFVGALSLHAGDEVFSTTPAYRMRNLYANIQNKFDTATVHFNVGEFRLIRSGIASDVAYNKGGLLPEDAVGIGSSGVDPVLSDKYKTAEFTPVSGDSIGMYFASYVTTKDCANVHSGGDPPPPGAIGTYPNNWKTAIAGIPETTIVIVRIEDPTTPSIFADLDSVVVLPNPASKYVGHTGMSMDTYNHKYAIPNSMWGRTSRIRLLIKRTGSGLTPYGAIGNWQFARIALSAYSYPGGASRLAPTQNDSLEARYKVLAETYMRTVLTLANDIPKVRHLLLADTAFHRILADYYYVVQDTVNPLLFRYFPRDRTKDTAGKGYTAVVQTAGYNYTFPKGAINDANITRDSKGGISILETRLNSISGTMDLKVFIPDWVKDVSWYVTDLLGKEQGNGLIWPGFKGEGTLTIPYAFLQNQVYLLKLVDNQMNTTFTVKVVRQ